MAEILITGGAGFIAGALAGRLARQAGDHLVLVDNLETGSMKKVPASQHKNVTFIRADVNNPKELGEIFSSHRFDYVFHYAALVGVQRTLSNPIRVLNDLDGIRHILELSKRHSVKRIFYSSSSEVYGEPVQIPQNEHTTPLNSRLPYAIVKNAGEAYMRAYHSEYGMDYTIFRFFNTYGPLQSDDFVISRFLQAALRNEAITIYGDGRQTRTFCYIDDNAECCERIFRNDLYVNDVINIGSDVETSILDLAKLVIRITSSSSSIVHLPPLPEGDMTRRKPDISKMSSVLERPMISLESGIGQILNYQKN